MGGLGLGATPRAPTEEKKKKIKKPGEQERKVSVYMCLHICTFCICVCVCVDEANAMMWSYFSYKVPTEIKMVE